MCSMDTESWLGEVFKDSDGTEVSLPADVQTVLQKAFVDGVLDAKQDVLDDAVELASKRMKALVEVFQVAYKDIVPTANQKQIHLVRIDRWLRARHSEDEDEASSVLDGKVKEPAKGKPSEAEAKDLAAQGLASPRQMRVLELSLYLGRPVGDAELEGGSYRSPASTFKGATLAKKGGDLVTIDMVIKQALADGLREPLEDWMTELLQLMGEDSTAEMVPVAARISLFWNQVRSDFKSPKMVARYLQLYRKRYQGRGIPMLTDDNLRSAVFSALLAEKEAPPQVPTAPASLASLSSYSGSTTGSSVASSAGAAVAEANSKMLAVLDKVLAGQTEMKDVQTKLNQKVLAIERTLNSGGDRCFLCGETGHKKEACPNKEKFTRSGKLKAEASES